MLERAKLAQNVKNMQHEMKLNELRFQLALKERKINEQTLRLDLKDKERELKEFHLQQELKDKKRAKRASP